jgi:protoporphyrinogen oxidase
MILGAGVTGLAAGMVSGLPVYEAEATPGGICSSYYMIPGSEERLHSAPPDCEAYRFEIGGGHWIFGGDSAVLSFINSLTATKEYIRESSVFLPDMNLFVPYPLQNNLASLPKDIAVTALRDLFGLAGQRSTIITMADWNRASFGATLCDVFFDPFHELYTAGLYARIAPQDSYKSPASITAALDGFVGISRPAGYNTRFVYPIDGLDALTHRMAKVADVKYDARVVAVDADSKEVMFANGRSARYDVVISTLPLNRLLGITNVRVTSVPDPSVSVLVLNIGAYRGPRCPSDQWVYVPRVPSGFHRVGFYSNVDPAFLPSSARAAGAKARVAIYVERAFTDQPSADKVKTFADEVVRQLQDWEWIGEPEVVDPTWIDVAYTWSWPGSTWRAEALRELERRSIFPLGRYGRWIFQGIADSIRDGFMAGAALAAASRPTI